MTRKRHILIVYAHPNPSKSYVQKVLLQAIQDLEDIEIRDLYRLYPHGLVDTVVEQEAVQRADLIIFQHPLYWYSCPSLLKEWQDIVLEPGFAYGPGGLALQGKDFLQVLSLGALESTYHRQGGYRFSLPELLRPFEATAFLCGLNYHWPLAVQGGTRLTEAMVQAQGHRYRQLLEDYQINGSSALVALNTAIEGYDHD